MKSFFLTRYKQLGVSVEDIKLKQTIRTNTLKISNEDLRERLHARGIVLNNIPFLQNGFGIGKSRFNISASIEHLQGLFFIQETASQIPAAVLAPKQNDTVLDMCASPGGKTTQLAQIMKNNGTLVSLELKEERTDALLNNIERLGLKNTIVYNYDARNIKDLNLEFDKILLDAPCSGNFVTDKDWFNKRDINGIKKNSEIQKQLLEAGINALKKNGTLVYSTCSLEPEENELVIDWALKKFYIALETVDTIGSNGLTDVFGQKLDKQIKKCKRFWPNKTKTQGFFIAKIRKK